MSFKRSRLDMGAAGFGFWTTVAFLKMGYEQFKSSNLLDFADLNYFLGLWVAY